MVEVEKATPSHQNFHTQRVNIRAENAAVWLTVQQRERCRNVCVACRMPASKVTQRTSKTASGRAQASLSVCMLQAPIQAGGGAILAAVTAGQSSVVAWVSTGHGCSLHYHMGVATSALPPKVFWSATEAGKVPGMPVQDEGEKKEIIKTFNSLKSH